jgi:hypothetical protein
VQILKIAEMNNSQNVGKNIRALFALGYILALLPAIGGGFIMAFGYLRAPGASMPTWEFGKYIMISGLVNLFVYICIFFQVRKVSSPGQ